MFLVHKDPVPTNNELNERYREAEVRRMKIAGVTRIEKLEGVSSYPTTPIEG